MIDLEEVFPNGKNMMRCWQFEDAPELLKKLSSHSGDEELVFVIPLEIDQVLDVYTPLFDIIYSGYIKPVRKIVGAYVVYITAH
jgi:hypothetical protein